MPRLVKGGKYTYGWSRVGDTGRIAIPPGALVEYGLREGEPLALVPGSRTSGGFGLAARRALSASPLTAAAVQDAPLRLIRGGVEVPPALLARCGVRCGDRLLAIRGSGLAVGFAVRGPIVAEAEKHPELEEFC